jgi:hypothetical protein
VSLLVLSLAIEDRDEVESRSKRPTLNDINYFIFKRITKKKSDMNSFPLLQLQ